MSLLSSGVQRAVDPASPSDKAMSVTVLLTQALRADDRQLLEKCFAISNDKVVKSTVQQLAPQDVARLLQVAVQRLQSSPKRGRQIATWLRAMLLHHTAYLMSAPGMFSLGSCAHCCRKRAEIIYCMRIDFIPACVLSGNALCHTSMFAFVL